ncbi:unnamed protein product [Eruca vesicaria subsp. sativa]|uniref:Uncharacterized protein n=1 Tax=Eruca vesicaria subsp. sativa TaxID=29727 RepID=A0ABC8JHB9_ERUVS|nr:unnamed protein product [Eruca vesicaria subsp. sativa]
MLSSSQNHLFSLFLSPSSRREQHVLNHFISAVAFLATTDVNPDKSGGYTSLLELPSTQAVELFDFSDSSSMSFQVPGGTGIGLDISTPPLHSYWTLTFPSNSALLEQAACFSRRVRTCH